MIRGIIIEGMSTTGKSSLFSAIKRLHSQTENDGKTIIAISEHYSQVLHSNKGILSVMDKDDHIRLLDSHVSYLEQQYNWMDALGLTKTSTRILFLFERFHINHRAAFVKSPEIELIEKRLLRLNAHCVLLTLSQKAVQPRFIESRSEAWKSYVMKNHSTVADACQKFLKDQENLLLCAKQSFIPTQEINTDEADWDSYAKQIFEQLA